MTTIQESNRLKFRLTKKLQQMADTPKTQIKRLAVGTLIALLAMMSIVLTSHLESQWLFYILTLLLAAGIIYAIPGYIGIWVWRMKDTLFRDRK